MTDKRPPPAMCEWLKESKTGNFAYIDGDPCGGCEHADECWGKRG